MDPIGTFSGLASGIQWRDMVDQIMRAEIARRITPITNQVSAAQKRREAWNQYNGLLSKLSTAATALRDGSAFGQLRTSVTNGASGKSLLTATATSAAQPGSYQVEVLELARAQKLSGGKVESTTAPLGFSGDFHLNGKLIEVSTTDTLVSLRDRINAANTGSSPSGVSATILTTSPTEHRLVLTAAHTGDRGIEVVEGEGTVLQALGIASASRVQNSSPTDANLIQTQRFSSDATPLASVLGLTAPPVNTTIVIAGQKVEVDLENDTLLSVMNRVQAAGVQAELVKETVGGTTHQRLSVAGAVTADADADDPAASQRVLELLGFVRPELASSITAGADARIRVDGFEMTRRTNTVSDAIAGVTLSLQAAELGSPVEVNVARNSDAAVQRMQEFASAYNELVSFVESQRQPGAALAANGALRTMQASLTSVFLNGVTGLTGTNPYTHASLVGVSLTKTGTLEVDAAKLRAALQTNLVDVQALFSTAGTTSDGELSYVGSTAATQAGRYAVNITAPATLATHTGAGVDPAGYQAGDGVSDVLTITDSSSGKTRDFTILHGRTASEIAAELNAALAAEGMRVRVSESGGALRFEGQDYGSRASFTIAGAAAAGLGLTEGTFAGTDVEGTIGGLAATGRGRVLTGAAGGATAGLAVRYTGTTARAAGEVSFVLGVAGMMDRVVAPLTRAGDGVIVNQLRSIDASIESLNRRADDAEDRLEIRRQAMIRQFALMEGAMSQMQSQSTWLASPIQSMQPRQR